jgi:hypothetical protein
VNKNMSKVAVLCPIVRRPDLVAQQLDNYFDFHGEHGVHILHPAIGSGNLFASLDDLVSRPVDFILNDDPWLTSYNSIFGSILSSHAVLKAYGVAADFVYVHTDGDLLIEGDFIRTVREGRNAFTSYPAGPNWTHYEAMMKDQAFHELRKYCSIDDTQIFVGRQEGSFFETAVWLEMMELALRFFPRSHFEDRSKHWPIEEAILPTLCMRLLQNSDHPKGLILTKDCKVFREGQNARFLEENVLQIFDIEQALSVHEKEGCFGMKWFSQDIHHPARNYVMNRNRRRAIADEP